MPNTHRQLIATPQPAADPIVGGWLWALSDARQRTLAALLDLDQATLDWQPPTNGNSIGSLLYHIALIEADWLSAEVREEPTYPPALLALFPYPVRNDASHLTVVSGVSLTEHLARLAAVREQTVATFAALSGPDFHRPRHFTAYDVNPAWVAHHLLQHEAEHRGEIGVLRQLAAQLPATNA